ncbi:hypothetical protein [Xanthobacter pseudotagetidis]|uniref:hypothetical protein n=1 Tax=Xanthobacter pseudotagetidis TaxID=3119911 RepID=UPI003729F948
MSDIGTTDQGRVEAGGSTLFRPGPRTLNWLIPLGMGTVGWALYIRYLVLEPALVRLACEAGLESAQCYTRTAVLALYNWDVFGAIALAAAAVQLIRPSLPAFAVALAFSGLALVFHNELAGALAAMALMLSFARPGPATP